VIVNVLIQIINIVFGLAWWLILIRVLLSWLPMLGVRIDPYNPIIHTLFQLTDPILSPIRRFTTFGAIDFSPIVALFLLSIVQRFLITLVLRAF
jgi:YggT family protein